MIDELSPLYHKRMIRELNSRMRSGKTVQYGHYKVLEVKFNPHYGQLQIRVDSGVNAWHCVTISQFTDGNGWAIVASRE